MSLKIAAAALNQTPLDWSGNQERLEACLLRAKEEKVDVLCCPELAVSSYGCEDLFFTKDVLERSWQMLETLSRQANALLFIVGLPLLHKDRRYNVTAVVEDGQIVGFYAKQVLAREGVYYEPRWFDPWPAGREETFVRAELSCPIGEFLHTYKGYRVGFEICEDTWSDPRPAQRYAKAGVDIILSSHASHFALGKHERRTKLVKESSATFDCAFVYSNLLGNESGRLLYDGDLIMAYKGKIMASGSRFSFSQKSWLSYRLRLAPSLRADLFVSEEEEFTAAASLALFDYLRKSRAKGLVLSASGGADSSMCAVLVADMLRLSTKELGREKFLNIFPQIIWDATLEEKALRRSICAQILTMVYQSSEHSSKATLEAARDLAKELGARFVHWSIAKEALSYTQKVEGALGRQLSWAADDLALQNIQARSRTPALWLLANALEALLLVTSNRSEGSLGYATMDGDTAGGLAPLASLSKVFILRWLRWAEKSLPALRAVNKLHPTAELRPAAALQADEKDLMPYSVLLAIEQEAILHKRSPSEVLQILRKQRLAPEKTLKAYVKKFFHLWAQNQWKRERTAPSFHLDAYSIDPRSWCRFPILSAAYVEELSAL